MKNLKKKVIIAAGGTGGHIIPAISIAEELIKNNVDVLFVGNKNSMEQELTTKREIAFKSINVQKFYRKITLTHLKFPFKLIKSILDSVKIIRDFQPDAFIGTGGFVSGPVGYTAHLKKVPIFLQEQNSYPGATTRILSRYAEKIFLGAKEAEKYLPKKKVIFSGNPVNSKIIGETAKLDFDEFGLKKDTTKLFLTGGSQGSVVLNKTFLPIVDELLENGIEIIWQIGKFSFSEFYPKIQNKKGIYSFDFTDEIGKVYNSVDFVIARAGAISLAELETKKLPSILIPLPSAAGNHQYYNAMELQDKGVAIVIEQNKLTSASLLEVILKMKNEYKKMKEDFRETKHLKSAENISKEILGLIK
ncbi:MAG: undecaprenyldiphospho-muramoylpentapeptide beta-N-acetylglucosaminyltransferase [Candidatus Cloacimonetes bacterium]|nr:undecaprenyldiphospho-muramoylpentapeptide beta-N-acetylglucosaminyltransferase [Candidatus Cloacimonadota bacterium]MBL7149724.1 undecaprenyldiphospho-muramoylpentapeptide beta-N-acetylglucosaminyltransferase [Candidatus Cloacimonadota bacterium]